jgi:protein required for attachment to host cells
MNANDSTWILVADAARARLYECDGSGAHLKQINDFHHAESRTKNHELVADRPGRMWQSHVGPHPGRGSKSSMEPSISAKEAEHEHFARQLAATLVQGLNDHAYGRLILVANPDFLGLLRRFADEQVRKHVVASVDKDYTALTTPELLDKLAAVLHP